MGDAFSSPVSSTPALRALCGSVFPTSARFVLKHRGTEPQSLLEIGPKVFSPGFLLSLGHRWRIQADLNLSHQLFPTRSPCPLCLRVSNVRALVFHWRERISGNIAEFLTRKCQLRGRKAIYSMEGVIV
jgi:hypothetical protein